MFSDVDPLELLTIVIIGVLLFGPDKLPELIQNASRAFRIIREFSESAKQEIRTELGPDYKDFEFEDLHPKKFMRKHVLDGGRHGLELDEIRSALDPREALSEAVAQPPAAAPAKRTETATARHPEFDPDATWAWHDTTHCS